MQGSGCGQVLSYYPDISLQEQMRTTKNLSQGKLAGLGAEIWSRDLPKTKQEC
jgi:hypothetical protein